MSRVLAGPVYSIFLLFTDATLHSGLLWCWCWCCCTLLCTAVCRCRAVVLSIPSLLCYRSGFFVDGESPQRGEVCAAVAALKRAAEQFGESVRVDKITRNLRRETEKICFCSSLLCGLFCVYEAVYHSIKCTLVDFTDTPRRLPAPYHRRSPLPTGCY